ncbi:MAG: hypothetical protein ACTTH0_00355 [Eubacteriales bacterium]
MLYSIDSKKYVSHLPHKEDFDKWMKNLSAGDYQAIVDTLNKKINDSDVNTAGWLPGHDWTGSVYEPIYKACGQNKELSGKFFELIVFDLLLRRTGKTWGFGKFELGRYCLTTVSSYFDSSRNLTLLLRKVHSL